ncbi:hypothetical protein F5146DRAFT_1125279 [Armillaria mellea]|nr:hypothetical protein F5146DRAFT_1125279 [Armillaria mellea]
MPALNACLQVARLAEAAGDSVPYLESVAKVAVLVFKLLDARIILLHSTNVGADPRVLQQKAKNKKSAKALCESIANTILVVNNLVLMQGEKETSSYVDICGEMEKCLRGIVQELKDLKLKHRGLKGVFCVDDFKDTIQACRRHVDDLKTDFLIHSVGDCRLEVTQMHSLLKDAIPQGVLHPSEEFIFRIPKKPAAITAFFFFTPDLKFLSRRLIGNLGATYVLEIGSSWFMKRVVNKWTLHVKEKRPHASWSDHWLSKVESGVVEVKNMKGAVECMMVAL